MLLHVKGEPQETPCAGGEKAGSGDAGILLPTGGRSKLTMG